MTKALSTKNSIYWTYDQNRHLITAHTKVTNDMVDQILEEATYLGYKHIVVYSGVHGEPGGTLQVDDPQFFATDKEAHEQVGSLTLEDPKIEVIKMPFVETAPTGLTNHIADPSILVILAWCFSEGYIT